MSGPSIVQTAGQAPASSGTVAFTLGSSPTPGDVLVAYCSWNPGGPLMQRSITRPAGWRLIDNASNNGAQAITAFWYVVQAGDGAAWSFTVNNGGIGNDYTSGALYELSGASAVFPVNQYAPAVYATASGSLATASVAPTVTGCLALAGWTTDGAETFSGVSTGWAEDLSENSSYHTTFAAHRTALTADTTTPVSATLSIGGSESGASIIVLIGPVPPPSPYFVQVTSVPAAMNSSIAFTLPSAPGAGDLLVAAIAYNAGTGTRTVPAPAGWTKVDDTGPVTNDSLAIFTYVAQPGDPATWSFPVTTTGSSDFASGILYEITGQAAASPVSQHAVTTSSPYTTPSATPSVLGCLPLAFLTTDGPHAVTSVSSGWTDDQDSGGVYHSSFAARQRLLTTDTATGVSNTWTLDSSDAGSSAILLIAPASGGGTTHNGAAALAGTGTLSAGAHKKVPGAAALAGTGTLSAAGHKALPAAAALSGSGTFSGSGTVAIPAAAALSGQGTLSGIGRKLVPGAAPMSGAGTLSAAASKRIPAAAALTGSGTLRAAAPPVRSPGGLMMASGII